MKEMGGGDGRGWLEGEVQQDCEKEKEQNRKKGHVGSLCNPLSLKSGLNVSLTRILLRRTSGALAYRSVMVTQGNNQ